MKHAIKIASEFVDELPKDSWSPETTTGREGFVHPTSISGVLEKATVGFIIRDHDTTKLKVYEDRLQEILEKVIAKYPGVTSEFKVKEQYRKHERGDQNSSFCNRLCD
jgi:tripeptide aminopeptidase